MASPRLAVSDSPPGDAPARLRRELLDFRVKIGAAAHASFNAPEGAHDDVLLSVAIACWLGSRREIAYRASGPCDRGRIALLALRAATTPNRWTSAT